MTSWLLNSSSCPKKITKLFILIPDLGLNSGSLLGEGDCGSLGEVGSGGHKAILISGPVDFVGQAISTDELIRSPHDDNIGITNGLDGANSLLLDAVLRLKGVVKVGAGLGGAVVHRADDGDGLGRDGAHGGGGGGRGGGVRAVGGELGGAVGGGGEEGEDGNEL